MEKALDARARLRQKKTMTAAEMDSFCTMYDDIIKAFELQRKEKYEAEDSLLSLAMVMEKTRQKYVDLSSEVQDLRHNNTVLENELKTISTKYRLARDSLYEETKAKELLQKEIKDMEGTVALVKDIIFENNKNIKLDESQRSRLVRACSVKRTDSIRATPMKKIIPRRPVAEETFFDETCMSQDDISFDDTIDEDFQPSTPVFKTPRRGKRSVDTLKMDETNFPEAHSTICSSENDSMAKKSKIFEESEPAFKGTVSAVKRRSQGFTKPTGATARRRQSRHLRQSAIMEDSFEVIQEEKPADVTPETDTISNADSFFQTPQIAATQAKPRKLKLDRTGSACSDKSDRSEVTEHKFTTSRVLTFETCRVCFKGIKFYSKASKCDVCKVICHPDCISKLDIACKDTSVPLEKITVGPKPLETFVDKSQKPRIPGAIYYAIHGVDQHLTEEGIYRIPGSTKTLQEIKRKVLFGDVNSIVWADVDTHTLASFVKDFLRCQISEPILTYKLLPQVIEAAKHGYSEVLKKLVKKLPDANRDTLAFIIVHLQNVITNSKKNQMSQNSLAIAIGPSLVGFTKEKPTGQEIKDAAEYQEIVAENLLQIPREFYWALMDVPENNIVANEGADSLL